MVIIAEASPDTFIDVSVPSSDGFIIGGEESFSTEVTVRAYIRLPFFGYVLINRYQFTDAALEFGVGYMCEKTD